MADQNPIIVKHLTQIVGKKVTGIAFDGDETYGLMFAGGTIAWISRDAEGNGPGHLDIVKP